MNVNNLPIPPLSNKYEELGVYLSHFLFGQSYNRFFWGLGGQSCFWFFVFSFVLHFSLKAVTVH